MRGTNDLPHEDDVLAADEVDAARDVGERRGGCVVDALVRAGEDEVG